MRRFILYLAMLLLTFIVVSQALPDPITGGPDGITDPTNVINFNEVAISQGQEITTEFALFGATFENFGWDNLTLGQAGSTGFYVIGCLVNGYDLFPVGTMVISFTSPVTDAAFAAVDADGSFTLTSFYEGNEKEHFDVTIVSNGSPPKPPGQGFLGFKDSLFDKIEIQLVQPGPGGFSFLSIDTLQFNINSISISIDIKPGSDLNTINRKSNGVIPVAILGSENFDVADVDVTTLEFMGASPVHDLTDPVVYAGHIQDVNGDGFPDLLSHYRVQETSIPSLPPGDAVGQLEGKTKDGTPILGEDSITVNGSNLAPSASRTITWGNIKAGH